MIARRARRALAVAGGVLVLSACAGTGEPARLHFGMEDAPEGQRVLFPPPPEVPRYMYAGQLIGEVNFVRDPKQESAVVTALKWIAGLFEGAAAPLELQRPQAVAVDSAGGRILVSDVSKAAVFVFDQRVGELQVWDRADGLRQFVSPIGLALLPAGETLVADADLGLVARLGPDGTPREPIGRGVLKRPTGLAWDGVKRRLYVADTYDHDIKVFDGEFRLIATLGQRGEELGQYNYPTFLTLVGERLYVTDTMNARVQVIDPETGQSLQAIGERGLYVGNMVRPKGVAVDGYGHVYVVESYYDHLLVFDQGGQLLLPIGGLGKETGNFYLPSGVTVDEGNRVFVADTFNGRVVLLQYLGTGGEDE